MTERAAGFQPKLGTLNDGADKTHGVTVTQRRNFSDFRCGIPPVRRQLAAPRHPAGPTPAQLMMEKFRRRKAAGRL